MENSNGVNQKIATWVGTVIIIIIAVTVVVFVVISQKDNPIETAVPQATVKNVKDVQSAAKTGDADVDAINSDLNSVSDEDFGDASLSDTAVGL